MLPEGGGPSVSANRTGVAIGLPGHGQGSRGPGFPHGHPGGGDAAPGPGRGGLQGADDPEGGMRRASRSRWFPELYKALMDRIGGPGALAEGKVNWRCNTKQWWVGAVYTNDMIKLMGLDPSAPGCRTGADGPDIRPRVGEGDEGIVYPPITADNVHVRTTGRRTIRWR